MRHRRISIVKPQQPSLVPLADMLANTVGIMLFILVFTILTTGGSMIEMQLPIEAESDAEPLSFLCLPDRIVPADVTNLMSKVGITTNLNSEEHVQDLGGQIDRASQINGASVEGEYMSCRATARVVRGDLFRYYIDYDVEFVPREGKGIGTDELDDDHSAFVKILTTNDPKQKFVYFYVRGDTLETFRKARLVSAKLGFHSGWTPLGTNDNIVLGNGEGGYSAKPQN